MGMIRVIKPKI